MSANGGESYWHQRCLEAEGQIEKFQGQVVKVKELLDAKLREVDASVGDARERADRAGEEARNTKTRLNEAKAELALWKDQARESKAQRDGRESSLRKQLDELTELRQDERRAFDRKMNRVRDWVEKKILELDRKVDDLQLKQERAVEVIKAWSEFGGMTAQTHIRHTLATIFGLNESTCPSPSLRPRSMSLDSPERLRRLTAGLTAPASPEPIPPPLPVKRSSGSLSAFSSGSYVQLDPSNPGPILVRSVASARRPSQGLTTVAEGRQMATSISRKQQQPNGTEYVSIDPLDPNQLLLPGPESVNGDEFEAESEELDSWMDSRSRFDSTTDSFMSAVQSLTRSSCAYDESVSVRESPYEVPIEELRRRGTPILPPRSKSRLENLLQSSLSEDAEEKIPPPLPHRNVPPSTSTANSFEENIYSLASESINSPSVDAPIRVTLEPVKFTASFRRGKFMYKEEAKEAPVFATLQGRAAQLRGAPFCGESTDSSGSEASILRSGRPRTTIKGDYEVPADALAKSEEFLEARASQFRLSAELLRTRSLRRDELEKSGYLAKLGSKMKNWKRYWFVLSAEKLTYYRAPIEVGRKKPRGVIELDCFSRFSRSAGTHTFEIATDRRTYYLTAESATMLEEWMKVLQNVLQKSVGKPKVADASAGKISMKGWVVKVKRGRPQKRWCVLANTLLSYYKKQSDKVPVGHIDVSGCYAREVDNKEFSGSESEDMSSSSTSMSTSGREFTLEITHTNGHSVYYLVQSKQEKDSWLYHLGLATGNLVSSRAGTDTEKVIDHLMAVGGNPESNLWLQPVLSHTDQPISQSLTTLPSESLEKEALQMFKSIQLFTSVPINYAAISYHINLAQAAVSDCLTKVELQNEFYCQLIRQSNRHPNPDSSQALQFWMLLALACPVFLPKQKFLWYFKQYLQGHASMRPLAVRYAVYCQRSVERAESSSARESGPSRLEVLSVLLGDALKHSNPLSIPIHFANISYQVVSFDGSTTVQELTARLSQELGMRDPLVTGFALFTDDPCNSDREHCLETDVKVCDAISMWEQSAREGNQGRVDLSRSIRMTFKNRLYFRNMVLGETEKERMLMLYQALESVIDGLFPANEELAIDLASLMLQIEFGNCKNVEGAIDVAKEQQQQLSKVFTNFYPQNLARNMTFEIKRQILNQVTDKWSALLYRSPPDCARIYLNVCRRWPFFGAKLFPCRRKADDSDVWLGVQEHFISVLESSKMRLIHRYPYENLVTFGGHKNDFMIVVKKQSFTSGFIGPEVGTEKFLFGMTSGLVVEATNLVASYINAIKSRDNVGYLGSVALSEEKQGANGRNSDKSEVVLPAKLHGSHATVVQ
eukprot:m.234035 g.234035  ORF g.234035 m.234035 type:complete len:1344 (+) comp40102_c3_seq8:1064-5095(+)